MHASFSRGIAASASVLAVLSAPALAGATGAKPGPSAAAIRHAESSSDLWATVDICNSARHPDMIGIRAQMPSLGFTTLLYMRFQVDYYSYSHGRFLPDPGVGKAMVLGRGTHGMHQGGVTFHIAPPAVLSGTVTFEWRLGDRVLGRAVRHTSNGHRHVDHADPPGYSTAACRF